MSFNCNENEVLKDVKPTSITVGREGFLFENDLFGINAEITRKVFFGGLSAQMLNNRKLYSGKEFPSGWNCKDVEYVTDRKEDSLCGSNYVILKSGFMSQTSDVIATKAGNQYEAKLWIKVLSESAVVTFGIKGQEKEFVANANSEKYEELSFVFEGSDLENGTFCIASVGEVAVFEASLIPCDHFYNMRRDVIEAIKDIAPTSIRFPGGCAADHFDWRQSLKPVELREPMHGEDKWFLFRDTYEQDCLDIGINEFMMLCKEVGAKPEYTVSLLLSDGEDARNIVEYCNGDKTTKYGGLRQSLGFDPFDIKLWYVGNEAYYFGGEYKDNGALAAIRTNELTNAMRKADSSIQTVIGLTWSDEFKKWNFDFVNNLDSQYEYVSYHNYIGILPDSTQGLNGKATCEMIENNFADGEDYGLNFYKNELYADKFDDVNICADEWNYAWGQESSNGLFYSNALQFHFFAKSSEKYHIRKAQFFAPVNEGMISVKGTECKIESTGELFKLMALHKNGRILDVNADITDVDILCTEHEENLFMTVVNRSSVPYNIAVGGYDIVSCKQISIGEFSFTSNDFVVREDTEPIVEGHSVIGISLYKI